MKRLLNTLYVTTQGAYLGREGDSLEVRIEGEAKMRLPLLTLSGIVCFGRVSCSPSLLGLCGERGVTISFLSERGRFLARLEGPVNGNVLLRRRQFRLADDVVAAAAIARSVLVGKLINARAVLQRAARDRPKREVEPIEGAVNQLASMLRDIRTDLEMASLRGMEGLAARAYFEVLDHLIVAQKEDFFFRGRSRRPPLDRMNALLSFLYTLLANDVAGALESVGLDPQVGYLHADRPGRPGLALDLMEEFRAAFADRLALSLVNLRQIRADGFETSESGAISMDDSTRKTLLVAYQKRKQEEIRHPFLDEKMPIGMLPFAQALLLSRHIRGELDAYPPFLWR